MRWTNSIYEWITFENNNYTKDNYLDFITIMKTRNEQLSKYNNFYDKSRKLSKRAKLYSIVYRGVKVLKE